VDIFAICNFLQFIEGSNAVTTKKKSCLNHAGDEHRQSLSASDGNKIKI